MVFFIELLFFVVALGIIALGETFGAPWALGVVIAILAISLLLRARYAASPVSGAFKLSSASAVGEPNAAPVSERALAPRDELEAQVFRDELLRGWKHFNLLLIFALPFVLGWVILTR